MEAWLEAARLEQCNDSLVRSDDGLAGAVLHRLSKNGVTAIIVDNEHVVVASGGRDNKLSWEIIVDFSSDGFTCRIYHIGAGGAIGGDNFVICWVVGLFICFLF